MPLRAALIVIVVLFAGCARPAADAGTPTAATSVSAAGETEPTVLDGANGVAIWVHPADPSQSLILGAAGSGGLEVYGLDGTRRQRIEGIEASQVTLRYGFDLGRGPEALVLVYDPLASAIAGFTIGRDGRLSGAGGSPIAVDDELTGLCSFRSPITGRSYALGMTDGGQMLQWELYAAAGELRGSLVRSVPLGKGIEYCTVDDAGATMYYGDEALGVMILPVEPESDPARKVLDLGEPRGGIAGVKGLAFLPAEGGSGRLVVADAAAERFAVYRPDGALEGRFTIGAAGNVDAVGESEGLALAGIALGERFPGGLLVVADQDNDGAASNYKLVSWRDAVAATGLTVQAAADPRSAPASSARLVRPARETPAVRTWGDAADDPAIWVNPSDPSKSIVIATDKNLGLYVYDLDGRLLQTLPDGRMNNVDLRDGMVVNGKSRTIVAASNRTNKSIALYWLDPVTRRLSSAGDPVPTGFGDPYGVCMFADASGHYVFVNDNGNGLHRQWRITAQGGRAVAERVRDIPVGSQAEGCAADDETGSLYIAEEDGGFWKYSARPDGGTERTEIDRVGGKNGLEADIEGVEIWTGEGGKGFVVLSNQGADNYAVYRREGNNAYVGSFHVVADPDRGIDGVSETDGLDVVSAPLGSRYPDGLLVVQDGRNLSPRERQNFKYVSWRDVSAALGLQ